ncbi:hypothetical protein [Clostridium butyricum]|uniref:hypothetical protein n=1 Tax=Clostridium butyricum TaxID=1492 RepID=UPI000903FA72|nr:hypothetical protein [Clostridium butyricum]APF21041.1 hypothetical protein NPD4_3545 [Clostridium butyricum]
MSKLDIRISYKDACILKHALRDIIRIKENMDKFKIEISEKELEEEKRTLERFTEQIEECGFKHNRNMFKRGLETKYISERIK